MSDCSRQWHVNEQLDKNKKLRFYWKPSSCERTINWNTLTPTSCQHLCSRGNTVGISFRNKNVHCSWSSHFELSQWSVIYLAIFFFFLHFLPLRHYFYQEFCLRWPLLEDSLENVSSLYRHQSTGNDFSYILAQLQMCLLICLYCLAKNTVRQDFLSLHNNLTTKKRGTEKHVLFCYCFFFLDRCSNFLPWL